MPSAFLGAVAMGLVAGAVLPQVATIAEIGIALGFAALPVAFVLRGSGAFVVSLAAAVTGLAHGLAHGSEGAGAAASAAGVLAATAALVGAAYLVARFSARRRRANNSR